jgi:hypothetical protein
MKRENQKKVLTMKVKGIRQKTNVKKGNNVHTVAGAWDYSQQGYWNKMCKGNWTISYTSLNACSVG